MAAIKLVEIYNQLNTNPTLTEGYRSGDYTYLRITRAGADELGSVFGLSVGVSDKLRLLSVPIQSEREETLMSLSQLVLQEIQPNSSVSACRL